jgi:hypothetical protein
MTHELLKIAEREVGTREEGGNNSGRRIREYQTATNLKPAAWPWCAAFVDFCIREWLQNPYCSGWLKLKIPPDAWRPKTALAYGFYGWSKERPKTTLLLTEKAQTEPGDIVMFDFSHVGFVSKEEGDFIHTIEGNTNQRGERDSVTGDGVYRKIRHKSLVRNYIRIRQSV